MAKDKMPTTGQPLPPQAQKVTLASRDGAEVVVFYADGAEEVVFWKYRLNEKIYKNYITY